MAWKERKKKRKKEDKKSIEIDTGTIKRFKRVEFLPVSIEAAF